MSLSPCRSADYVCVFDGQSLTVWPSENHINSFPIQMMSTRRSRAVFKVVGVSGLAWTQLDNDFSSRVAPFAKMSPVSFYLMVGGTTQVSFGTAASAIYDSEKAISDLARNAGFDYVIGSTTTPSYSFGLKTATVTVSATAGTYTLSYRGQTTAGLARNATASTVQTALLGLSTIGTGNVTVSGANGGPYTVTFGAGDFYSGLLIANGALLTGTVTVSTLLSTLNDLKRSDASNAYDALADLIVDPRLDDPFDTAYYADGTHPTTAGSTAIAELMGAAVDSLL